MIDYPVETLLRLWDAHDIKSGRKKLTEFSTVEDYVSAWELLETAPKISESLRKPPPRPFDPEARPTEPFISEDTSMRGLGKLAVPTKMPWQEEGEGIDWIKDQIKNYVSAYSGGDPTKKMQSKDYWRHVFKELPGRLSGMVQGMAKQIGLDPTRMLPENMRDREGSVMAPEPTLTSFLQEKGKGAWELGEYVPKTAVEFMSDPATFIEERPEEAIILLGMTIPAFKPIAETAAKKMGIKLPESGQAGLTIKHVGEKKPLPMQQEYADILGRVSRGEVELPGVAGRGEVFKFKEGTNIPVFKEQIREMADPTVPDLDMGMLQEAFTPTISIRRQYPWLNDLYYGIASKKKAAKVHFDKIVGETTKAFKGEIKAAGHNYNTIGERLGRYYTTQQKGGMDILDAMGLEPLTKADLTPMELRFDAQMRGAFDRVHGEANSARSRTGQKEMDYVEHYMPWMRNLGALEEAGLTLTTANNNALTSHMQSTAFKHAHKRKMHQGRAIDVPIEMNAFKVFDAYMQSATNHIHLGPQITRGRALLEEHQLPTGEIGEMGEPGYANWKLKDTKPNLANWTESWLDYVAGKSDLSTIKWKRNMHIMASKLNKNQAAAVLSGNVRSAIIQPSALKNVYALLNEEAVINGLKAYLSPAERARAMKVSNKLATRNVDIHATEVGKPGTYESVLPGKAGAMHEAAMDSGLFRTLSNAKRTASEKGIKYGLQALDFETAKIAWLSSEWYAKNVLKMTDKKAIQRYADDMLVRTQASGELVDVAPIQRSAIGRLATLYQTFNINDWDMMLRDVVGHKGPDLPPSQRAAKMLRYAIATEALGWFTEGVVGIESPGPAITGGLYENIRDKKSTREVVSGAMKEAAEALPLIGGSLKWGTAYRTPMPAAIQLPVDLTRIVTKLMDLSPEKLDMFDLETVGKALGIPGSTQVRKYISRRKRGMNHLAAILGVIPPKEAKDLRERYSRSGRKPIR